MAGEVALSIIVVFVVLVVIGIAFVSLIDGLGPQAFP